MLQRFVDYIARQHLFSAEQKVLLAVSGGRDSVTLCHLMRGAGFPFAVAHCNFHLRGGDSERDEGFVRALAARYGVECFVASFRTAEEARAHGVGIEEEARAQRYAFFARVLREEGLACVATAHHADDSIETFFLNLLRGTGIGGLHGIRPRSSGPREMLAAGEGRVVHPMLCFSRAEIDGYVQAEGLEFVEDYTNASPEFRRNDIRLRLLPLLRDMAPRFDVTMGENLGRIAEAEEVYRGAVERCRGQVVRGVEMGGVCLPVEEVRALRPQRTLLYELLRPYGFSLGVVDEVLRHLGQGGGRLFFSGTHRLSMERTGLYVEALQGLPDGGRTVPVPLPGGGVLSWQVQAEGVLLCCSLSAWEGGALRLPPQEVCFDVEGLRLPLLLRHWREGDRFWPFGMRGSQLVSDYFSDHKFTRHQREGAWLLCDAEGTILWIVGHRASRHGCVGEGTRQVLRMVVRG